MYKGTGNRGLSKVNSKFCISLRKLEEALQSAMLVRYQYIKITLQYYISKLVEQS